MSRPIPLLDDLPLDAVLWVRQRTQQRLAGAPVLGLEGDVQQRLGRASHEIEIAGLLVGDTAFDDLGKIQGKGKSGEEVAFTADICSALELDKVVIASATFEEEAGRPGRYRYHLLLRESPLLPPPAELSPFGGLDGMDLGFDTDILGDIASAAGDLQGAMNAVGDALGALDALSGLANLNLGNPVEPLQGATSGLAGLAEGAASAGSALTKLLGGG